MSEVLSVGYFLEDIAHERFLTALVERVAESVGLHVRHDVRNSSGGKGRALTELRQYLQDVRDGRIPCHPLLVVAVDGNCRGYQKRRREIEDIAAKASHQGVLVCAVPEPHIERWYLADPKGFRAAVPGSRPLRPPSKKCERGFYKRALKGAFDAAGIAPQLGGAEYAADIVARMDISVVGRRDKPLGRFLADLRSALSAFAPRS